MKKILFLLVLVLANNLIFAQDLENSKWYFGNEAALTFNNPGSNPSPLNNSVMNTIEGCASVSSCGGNLLFYTDGDTVWNSNHAVMTGGTNIGGDSNTTQSAVIVPHPDNPDIYYIFTANGVSSGNSRMGFFYSTIDISLSSGLGSVTSKRQNLFFTNAGSTTPVQIRGSDSEKMTTHYDEINNVIWVVIYHDLRLLSFKVDVNGIDNTAISNSPLGFTPDLPFDEIGAIKVSPDGTKLVFTRGGQGSYLYDFDVNSGIVSNPRTSRDLNSAYGAEFSPDSNLLYLSGGQTGLTQNDISTSVIGSQTIISSNQFNTIQLAPNNKIYAARNNSNYLGVINNPNVSGTGSNFVLNGVSLGNNTSRLGLPQKVAKTHDICNFITTWQVDSSDTSITIPTHPSETYNYDVDWGDGSSSTGETGDATHNYGAAGTYTVKISGDFPRIYFDGYNPDPIIGVLNHHKIKSIDQWGSNEWSSMEKAFKDCDNLILLANDTPNLSNVTDMSYMFYSAANINQPINNWDVSNVENMSYLFSLSGFNQPLDNWDVKNVTNMGFLFSPYFNQNINNWDVSNVTNMSGMFGEDFNQPLNNWDVSNVTDMGYMFSTEFNQPLNDWGNKTSNLINMSGMFSGSKFNQPIGNWNVSSVESMSHMFYNAPNFHQSLNNWNVTSVISMKQMFHNATSFNQPLNNWDPVNVQDLSYMFYNAASFDQPLNNWGDNDILINVTDMSWMFKNATSFNQNIHNWDVDNVIHFSGMFSGTSSFNQPLNNWDVDNAIWMLGMFEDATNFDQPLNDWDVTSVIDMNSMFKNAVNFNQPLNNWELDDIIVLKYMFMGAIDFNQPLGDWDVSNGSFFDSMLDNSGLTTQNYDHLLDGWSQQNLNSLSGLSFGVGSTTYCNSAARAIITGTYGWNITDGGLDPGCRISNKIESEKDNVLIHPNPTSNFVEVSFKEDMEFYNGTVELSNTFGVLLSKEKYTNKEEINFDLSKQPKGVYILKFTNNNGEVTIKKIIKN